MAQRFPSDPGGESTQSRAGSTAIGTYLDSLHVADLALACACSAGSAAAWEFFVAQFRPELYGAARAICGPSMGQTAARDLADSLYADLYGLKERDGTRKSLFDYFHGRSKLGTWLRAVLAQRQVDEVRRARKAQSLDDNAVGDPPGIAILSAASGSNSFAGQPHGPDRAKYRAILQAALSAALNALAPRNRLRLAYYYIDELTLAQIGRLLGEHEATVSRQLERTRREVRKRVGSTLRNERKLTPEQIKLCEEYAREEWPFDLTQSLRAANPGLDRQTQAGALPQD
jgi:RNA polymerase sigma-70 factor, ECF subfamily